MNFLRHSIQKKHFSSNDGTKPCTYGLASAQRLHGDIFSSIENAGFLRLAQEDKSLGFCLKKQRFVSSNWYGERQAFVALAGLLKTQGSFALLRRTKARAFA